MTPRRPRDLTFRKNDAVRAIKAAQAAGIANPRIEIDREGRISIIAGEPPPKNGAKPGEEDDDRNEWDSVLQ